MSLKRWWWLLRNRKKLRYLLFYLTDPHISFTKKLLVLTPVFYLLLPTDLIPDFLLGPGFIDDIIIIAFLFRKIRNDLERYILKHTQNHARNERESVIKNTEYKIRDD